MKLVLIGKPGSGKGTQEELISRKFRIPVIATGSIFRNIEKEKTKLGRLVKSLIDKGNFVPDEITNEIIRKELEKKKGFILDGYPRNVGQAKFLDGYQKLDRVVYLEVPDSVIIRRLAARRECVCGMTYNLLTKKPKKDLICDRCGRKLYRRKDDDPRVARRRLNTYKKITKPVVDHYRKRGLLVSVNGNLPIEKTYRQILSRLRK